MDLFISYAWTTPTHREWVHLLAAQLHLLGYDVVVDKHVAYGSSLSGFMRTVQDARHVLLIVDEGYVHRADSVPESGVAQETVWIREVYGDRPSGWLAAVWVRNPERLLPAWLIPHDPLTFDFRADPETGQFPGSEQLDDLWRWLEDLPRDKTNAVPIGTQRQRAARLERSANSRDPSYSRTPAVGGAVHFDYANVQSRTYTVGVGDYEFPIQVSGCNVNSIYVLAGNLDAVGVVRGEVTETSPLDTYLTPGRSVTPSTGQIVVLMNKQGMLCTLKITDVQDEMNDASGYTAPYVEFEYTIHIDE